MLDPHTAIFEQHRRTLEGIAYRMLGTLAEARDVVQETWLKWHAADIGTLESPRAWLITVCSRLAHDLKSEAALLGASRLSSLAAELETACAQGAPAALVQAQLERVRAELASALQAVAAQQAG